MLEGLPDDEQSVDDQNVPGKEVLVVIVNLGDHRIEYPLEGHEGHEGREEEHVIYAHIDHQDQADGIDAHETTIQFEVEFFISPLGCSSGGFHFAFPAFPLLVRVVVQIE